MQNLNKGLVNKISQWDVARATRGHFIHGQKCLHGQMALVVLYLAQVASLFAACEQYIADLNN